LQFPLRGIRRRRNEVGKSTSSTLQQLDTVYQVISASPNLAASGQGKRSRQSLFHPAFRRIPWIEPVLEIQTVG